MSVSDRELWRRLSRRRLTIDGTDFVLTIHRRDALAVYIPLARELVARAETMERRFLVGIAGPPGAGKSATATILSALLEELGGAPRVVPLDGFHYPNSYLDTHTGTDRDGTARSLRDMKGRPVTFDAGRALDALSRLRDGESLSLPIYSRALHDPVENALFIGPEHRIILVEGNYLFLDAEPWRGIRELFDLRLFVTAPLDVLTARVRERHVRGGSSEEEARRKLEETDRPNRDVVLPTSRYAHRTIKGRRGALVICIT